MKVPEGTNYDESNMRLYFSRMSRVYALHNYRSATVMTRAVNRIPVRGIWMQQELPALTGERPPDGVPRGPGSLPLGGGPKVNMVG
jgi:hypothetical protein